MNTSNPSAKIASISKDGVSKINELQCSLSTKEGKDVILIAYEQ